MTRYNIPSSVITVLESPNLRSAIRKYDSIRDTWTSLPENTCSFGEIPTPLELDAGHRAISPWAHHHLLPRRFFESRNAPDAADFIYWTNGDHHSKVSF